MDFPKLRFVALLEIGTHAICAAAHELYKDHENTLAKKVLSSLKAGILLIADRGFGCYPVYSAAIKTGADLLFRVRGVMKFARLTVFDDGSYLSKLYPSPNDRRKDINGITVRVIEYQLKAEGKIRSDHQHSRSGACPRRRTGRRISRTLGNRNGLR